MPTTDGWSLKARSADRVCTPAEAREHLEAILTTREWVQWYSSQLDQLNEEYPTFPFSLKQLGYLNCRDEIMKLPLWDELSEEFKCHMLFQDGEDIELLTASAIDGVMSEYDETI